MQFSLLSEDSLYLKKSDFIGLYNEFREIFERRFSRCEELQFLTMRETLEAFEFPKEIHDLLHAFEANSVSCDVLLPVCLENHLLCFIPTENDVVVAVMKSLDPYFMKNVAADWLLEQQTAVAAELLHFRSLVIDPVTGLLNATLFVQHQKNLDCDDTAFLMLVELYPRSRSANEAKQYAQQAILSLQSCLGPDYFLYFLGFHVFAVFQHNASRETVKALAERLLVWMRKEGFQQMHIGFSWQEKGENQETQACSLLQGAENALEHARKKGPFALCDFRQLMNPERHPLAFFDETAVYALSKMIQGKAAFSLIVLEMKENTEQLLLSLLEGISWLKGKRYIFILRQNEIPQIAAEWLKNLIHASNLQILNAGISGYPCMHFARRAVLMQSKKALLHAKLLGEGAIACFDHVSCNVSGDIYYAEGNLRAAVREYKNGLLFDAEDCNVLNSLGVTYADLGKSREAQACFEKVLLHEKDNFMALYNLGLGYELHGLNDAAIEYYEKALAHISDEFTEAEKELQCNLGRLYCVQERYKEGVALLSSWLEKNPQGRQRGKILPFLGKAYFALKDYHQAILILQKSLNFNGYDAASMGRLGYLYYLTKQGDDIALSLCRKSTEIDGNDPVLKFFLAKLLFSQEKYEETLAVIKPCLRQQRLKWNAQLMTCRSYLKIGKRRRALYWLRKLENMEITNFHIEAELSEIQQEFCRIGKAV